MTESQRLQIKASEQRGRLNELSGLDSLDDSQRSELDGLTTAYGDTERQLRAALTAEAAQGDRTETHATAGDTESRERDRLRQRVSIGGYIAARLEGREPAGEHGEYSAACGTPVGEIPIDAFEARPATEDHADAVTAAPSTVGVNIGRVHPAVFAAAVAPRMGVSMPTVKSGTYAELRITTSATAGARTKGEARESDALVLGAVSTKPRSISARISFRAEDRLEIGTAAFEPSIRSNMTMALSSEYDDQCLTGSGSAPAVHGLLPQITRPTDNPAALATFDSLLSTTAANVDGIWARGLGEIVTLTNPATYVLSETAFRDAGQNHRGDISAAAYLRREAGGWWTSSRMPAAPASGANAKISSALVYRRGQPLTTCVHPVWSSISISDPYTDSASAVHHVTAHIFVGAQVMVVQPDAYRHVLYQTVA